MAQDNLTLDLLHVKHSNLKNFKKLVIITKGTVWRISFFMGIFVHKSKCYVALSTNPSLVSVEGQHGDLS